MKLTGIDWIVVAGYGVVLLLVGFGLVPRLVGERAQEVEEYLLAGRRLSLPLFVATLVATWYGAILGVGEFVYRYGVVAWLCLGVPYYCAAALFALFIAGRIRESQTLSIPEQMRLLYGEKAGWVAAVVVLVMTIPAAYLLMVATLLKALTGWSLGVALLVGAVFSVAYLYTGGFRADVITNAVQFVLMYAGFAALAGFSVEHFGAPGQMWQLLPESHRRIPGELGWTTVVVWWILALQTFVDPSFYQRCAAARSVRTARWGVALSIVFWFLFDSLTLVTGLYARAFLSVEPLDAYPGLAEAVLPPGWKGLFVVALFATIMSTLESYAFLSAVTVGHDLLGSFSGLRRRFSVRRLTQVGLVVTMVVAFGLAWVLPSVVELIVRTASIAVPALLFPFVFGSLRRYRLPAERAGWVMGLAAVSSAVWMVLRHGGVLPGVLQGIEPAFVGIVVGACVSLLWMERRYATV